MLTKTDILQADDLPRKLVPVPEWGPGAEVYIRTMTASERDAFEAAAMRLGDPDAKPDLANIRARFCVKIICDDTGLRLFADADAEALGAKSAAAIDRIFAAGQKMSGITDADVEEMLGNSGAGPN